jgi:phospholipid/cholesterol/gamma-HCH transport system substrate-binding protein
MKTESENRIRLGIFVTVAVTLFIVIIYFIGSGKHMFTKTFHINGTFKDLAGLQVGNNVQFTGMNVGAVSKVEIVTDSTVRVDMVIEKHVQKFMKKDAIATIGSEGLMGNKVINLLAGSPDSGIIEDGGSVLTITPVSIDDIMASLAVTTNNASLITADISVLTGSIRAGHGTIGKLFMDSSMATTLNQTLVNAKNAAGGFSENMEAVKHNFLLRGYYKKKEEKAKKDSLDVLKNDKRKN